MKKKIIRRYMMATTAIHKLGDISSDTPDLCTVSEEDEENYYGMWVTGIGFFGVRFPKETTKELTESEHEYYCSLHVQLADNPLYKLNTRG
ncbi:MAG: hypothetical protein KAS32_28725 [Candidatus Peribacteraceae bacterium]|nr:hypothetical protein [Candidatus Peribacteraceae bacterium]